MITFSLTFQTDFGIEVSFVDTFFSVHNLGRLVSFAIEFMNF